MEDKICNKVFNMTLYNLSSWRYRDLTGEERPEEAGEESPQRLRRNAGWGIGLAIAAGLGYSVFWFLNRPPAITGPQTVETGTTQEYQVHRLRANDRVVIDPPGFPRERRLIVRNNEVEYTFPQHNPGEYVFRVKRPVDEPRDLNPLDRITDRLLRGREDVIFEYPVEAEGPNQVDRFQDGIGRAGRVVRNAYRWIGQRYKDLAEGLNGERSKEPFATRVGRGTRDIIERGNSGYRNFTSGWEGERPGERGQPLDREKPTEPLVIYRVEDVDVKFQRYPGEEPTGGIVKLNLVDYHGNEKNVNITTSYVGARNVKKGIKKGDRITLDPFYTPTTSKGDSYDSVNVLRKLTQDAGHRY